MTDPQSAPDTPEEETPAMDEAAGDELAAAQARIAELEKKVTEIKDQALRALAEADNTRKRMERERQDIAKFAVSSFARDLLTVADNLRRALGAISQDARNGSTELDNIYTGVEATERELLKLFEKNSITRIDPQGQKFDANLHEVMFEVDAPGAAPGTIVTVLDPGYTIHERLLRPARVGVARSDAANGGTVDKEV
jgi:molecular chaperone GrpE